MLQQPSQFATVSALSASSLLLTDNGLIYLSNLVQGMNEGDVRITPINLINDENKLVPSNKIQCFGERSTYRVDLANGMTLKSTYNHCVRCGTSPNNLFWKNIETIQPGDRVAVPINHHYDGFGIYDESDDLAQFATKDYKNFPDHVLQGKEEFVKLFVEMILTSYRRPYRNDEARSRIQVKKDNNIFLEHEAISLDMARELQLVLLSCFGVHSHVIRHDGNRGTLYIENEHLHKLTDLIDIVYLLSQTSGINNVEEQCLNSLLPMYDYEKEGYLILVPVEEVKSVKREPVYNFILETTDNFIANGIINSSVKHNSN